ncbi:MULTISPECIES: DUF2817 domain-containing protein [unclassified Sphingomonas]|uniref:DUF2817 domain-containing protein n=1 Tax=unclassified Sphingomonas TaxID=196159 RepID=UPI0006F34F7F|nr:MULTISPECIES: DUF2817 domain-containing protein [unclassified Sphingomonas]KQX18561.1 hypothetical protein ASD17_15555 [Sphingomonas sp. Root1294]KQY72115.1 hypothetical protein ASD39_19420 [Sphingomonas sp. Root50]KRB94615.1 hypothetical protein ASE22_01335 [Sphingomonas sp. Root720]
MSSWEEYFAGTYGQAREHFEQAVDKSELTLITRPHPLSTPDRPLSMDAARIGSPNARRLLVLTSGVHGPELLCGSGSQVGLLEEGDFAALPADTAVLLVHAINPWGAANIRRVNEDNVDLCRNGVVALADRPKNAAYDALHTEVSGPHGREWVAGQGGAKAVATRYRSALLQGQYNHPDGFAYGGDRLAWSNATLLALVAEQAAAAADVVCIDIHSGLGPYGYGCLGSFQSLADFERSCRWFGPWTIDATAGADNPEHYTVRGQTTEIYAEAVGSARLTSLVLEFGTVDAVAMLGALLDEHWLYHHGGEDHPDAAAIRARLFAAFYPDDSEWRWAILQRTRQTVRQALVGLAGS